VPVPVDGINSRANSRYYVGYALDGGTVLADGFTVKLGPYYSVSEGVNGNKEVCMKTTTTTTTTTTTMTMMMRTTMTTTETTSLLLPPPRWNMINFPGCSSGPDCSGALRWGEGRMTERRRRQQAAAQGTLLLLCQIYQRGILPPLNQVYRASTPLLSSSSLA
jgi:hypothetical protein